MKLFLKGDRCFKEKCAVKRRNYAPGQHGKRRVKLQGYGLQLREKQRVKRIYGVLEEQFLGDGGKFVVDDGVTTLYRAFFRVAFFAVAFLRPPRAPAFFLRAAIFGFPPFVNSGPAARALDL